jgi:hypothetical protein
MKKYTFVVANAFAVISLQLFDSAHAGNQSIADLPTFNAKLIHHFACTALLVTGEGVGEETFSFAPVGGHAPNGRTTAKVGNDSLEASGNAQMLHLDWKRSDKVIASGMMMIQRSPTGAFVLLLGDPTNEGNQGSVNCVAVTYADLANKKGLR